MPSNTPPYSYARYVSSGSVGPYSINFDYLSSTHLSVSVDGVTQDASTYTLDTNANTVTFDSAPANGAVIVILRTTPKGKSGFQSDVADFSDGSVLTAADLDQAALGLLFVAQEAEDSGSSNGISIDLTDEKWNADSKNIKNLPAPTAELEAANKAYVDGLSLYNSPTAISVYTFTGDTSKTAFTMDPAPGSTDANAFLVDVGGVAQRPTTDYTVSGSVITFGTAPPTATITVRNIGVARDILAQPIKANATGDVSLTVKGIGSQTGDLQQWQDSTGAAKAKITSSGDFDILTGALKFAGQSSLKVMGIHTFSVTGTPSVGYYESNDSTGNNYIVSGLKATITPKSTSSKLLFIGSVRCRYLPKSQNALAGGFLEIFKNNTSSPGSVHNGSSSGTSAIFERSYVYGTTTPKVFHVSFCDLSSPNTTSQVTYDLTHKKYFFEDGSTATDFFAANFDANTNLMAVEYIQD
tara:strand:- start:3058 stop:4461 length:1404 start_codon:yes stop_codon:yes gene_type:complete